MNILKWGMTSLNKQMNDHTDEDVQIGRTQPGITVRATLVAVKPSPNTNGVKTTEDLYHLLVETAQLVTKKVEVFRGIRVFVGNRTFEVVNTPAGMHSAEDQHDTRTIIVCKEICP